YMNSDDAPAGLGWLRDHAARRTEAGLRRELRPRRADDDLLDLASNDYLGLARHPAVVEAGCRALRTWGASAPGSRLGPRPAPLPDLAATARRRGATLIVDEAHGVGVVGEGGRGAVHAAGLAGAPDVVVTATLSKALGSQGGAVLASRDVVDHVVDTARTFIFDTGLAPACVGAALAALRLLAAGPERAAAVRSRAREIAELAR